MPTEIKYLSEENIVCVKQSGKITAAEMRTNTIEVIRLVREHGTKLVLSDNTDMVTDAKTTDLFNLPKLYDELGFSKASKVANIMNIAAGRKENYHFYETVCRNRGYDVKLFGDRESAMTWLKKK